MKSILKKTVLIMIAVTMMLCFSVPGYASDSIHAKFADHMVGTSGNTAYYAVGIDGGGPLYKYNLKTRKQTVIAFGHWTSLGLKNGYLYACFNDYDGSDARNQSTGSARTERTRRNSRMAAAR